MVQINDISPTSPASVSRCVTGRMLSIACSPDGQTVFAGSYSNLWVSSDGGMNFTQVSWPQPPPDQFAVPGALGGWCAVDIVVGQDSDNQLIVLALMCFDRQNITVQGKPIGDRGIWRSADRGASWTWVYQFPPAANVGQLEWVLGSDHLVYAAVGTSLAISKNAGATFVDAHPFGSDSTKYANHVAVSQNAPTDDSPQAIYVLGNDTLGNACMAVSFDGGINWIEDQAALPKNIGKATDPVANANAARVMAMSPLSPHQVYITQDGSGNAQSAVLYLFDFSGFSANTPQSVHQRLDLWINQVLPETQDSGNVFLTVTPPGQGDLLFYGSQRSLASVASLKPDGTIDSWRPLNSAVHVDLHGLLLSPLFNSVLTSGTFNGRNGDLWLLTDGGIHVSSDGGATFVPARGVSSLGSFSLAGVAIAGTGPALSLNSGDNDGFYSLDGGATWQFQEYGGGDNDCAFADPLRPYSMFVCTPRWDGSGSLAAHASEGQTVSIYEATPGSLPNASSEGTSSRHVVTGPLPIPDPLPNDPNHTVPGWNADSGFYGRGSRPIVLGLVGEETPAQGDYVFVLNPVLGPVLVRSLGIFNISSRDEWNTTATEPIPGTNVYRVGPPLPAPMSTLGIPSPSLGIVQASGGHNSTVYYVGGDGTLQSWQEGETTWTRLVPLPPSPLGALGVSTAARFFVSPYLPSLIYVLDADHVKRSDDGGRNWVVDNGLETQLTWNGQIPFSTDDSSSGVGGSADLLLTDMKFDPNNPLLRFAVGQGGAFYTMDGTNWTRLLHTSALPSRPAVCYYDPITNPTDPALYVALTDRGAVKIDGFPIAAQSPTVVPASLIFDETQVGVGSEQQTVTVFAGTATITGISIVDETPGASGDFRCVPPPGEPFSVIDGQLLITLWFWPTAGGVRKAALEISHNAAGSPLRVELFGTGDPTPTPLLSVSPDILFFTTKKVTNHVVTLTNTGNAPLFILSISIDQPNFFFTTSCPVGANTLGPGQQCSVTVGYEFSGPGGSANLIIVHDAPGSPTMVDLEATSATGRNPSR